MIQMIDGSQVMRSLFDNFFNQEDNYSISGFDEPPPCIRIANVVIITTRFQTI